VRIALLVGAVVLTVCVVVVLVLRSQTPRWVEELPRATGVISKERAEAVERGAWAEFSKVRPMREVGNGQASFMRTDPWQVSLSAMDAEAWLTHRLAASTELAATWNLTSAQRVIDDVKSWRVRVAKEGDANSRGRVQLGMQDAKGRWTWAQVHVRGPARASGVTPPLVEMADVGQGRVGVPLAVLGTIGAAPDLVRTMLVLKQDEFWQVNLPDGRVVRVLAIDAKLDGEANTSGGRVILTCETVLKDTGR
jgi:hypothetical protein